MTKQQYKEEKERRLAIIRKMAGRYTASDIALQLMTSESNVRRIASDEKIKLGVSEQSRRPFLDFNQLEELAFCRSWGRVEKVNHCKPL